MDNSVHSGILVILVLLRYLNEKSHICKACSHMCLVFVYGSVDVSSLLCLTVCLFVLCYMPSCFTKCSHSLWEKQNYRDYVAYLNLNPP